MEKKNITLNEKEVAFVVDGVSVVMNYETALDFMEDTGLIDKFIDIDEEDDENDEGENEDEVCSGDCANCTNGPCANDTAEEDEDDEYTNDEDDDTSVNSLANLLDIVFGPEGKNDEKNTYEENSDKSEEDKLSGYIKLLKTILENRENTKKETTK